MRRLAFLPALVAAGCAVPAPPAATWAMAVGEAGGVAAGELAGHAFVWRDERFAPLAGAAIAIDGAPTGRTTDATGAFRCPGVPPGPRALTAVAAGLSAVPVKAHPSAEAGVAGIALVAYAPADGSSDRGARRLVGVVTDPRGAALPGATVHVVDDAGGNRRWRADAEGRFAGELADLRAGDTASLMAFGRLADGRPAEGAIRTVVAFQGGVAGAAVATHVVGPGEGSVNAASRGVQALDGHARPGRSGPTCDSEPPVESGVRERR